MVGRYCTYMMRLLFLAVQLCSSFFAVAIVDDGQYEQQQLINIIQLGDSFSSGNGLGHEHTGWYGPKRCYRNIDVWGQQAVELASTELDDTVHIEYSNHACSLSKIQHITTDYIYEEECGHEDVENDQQLTSSGPKWGWYMNQCDYTLAPQIENVDENTDIVLIAIGANDANFKEVITSCFVPVLVLVEDEDCEDRTEYAMRYLEGTLSSKECEQMKSEWSAASCNYETDLINVLETIAHRMKDGSKIIYIAYPHIAMNIDQKENQLLREVMTMTLDVQRKVVDYLSAVLHHVDVILFTDNVDVFAGHEANFPDASDWGSFATDMTNPDGWYNEVSPSTIASTATNGVSHLYHPNIAGHEHLAMVLAPTLESVIRELIASRESEDEYAIIDEENSALFELMSMSMLVNDSELSHKTNGAD